MKIVDPKELWQIADGNSDLRSFECDMIRHAADQIVMLRDTVVWAADCAAASYDWFAYRKNPPKYELERHRKLCRELIARCRRLGCDVAKVEEVQRRFDKADAASGQRGGGDE